MKQLRVIPLSSQNTASDAGAFVYKEVAASLVEKSTALLLSGGSCISFASEFLKNLRLQTLLPLLHVLLADERVNVSPADLNETQLDTAGIWQSFSDRGAVIHRLSEVHAATTEQRVAQLNSVYAEIFNSVEQVILFAGIGTDGHTVGMLPTKNESQFQELFATKDFLTYYTVNQENSANPFTERLTITLATLARTTQVYIFAIGNDKFGSIQKLIAQTDELHTLPALSLFLSEQPVTLLTDQTI